MTTTYEIKNNNEHNGIEIYFNAVPAKGTRDELKANGFRWHSVKKCWYARRTDKINAFIEAFTNNEITATPTTTTTATNKYGVKVGDIYATCWGYEQTNVEFFEVVALKGTTMATVREIGFEIVETTAYMQDDIKPLPGCYVKDSEPITRRIKPKYGLTDCPANRTQIKVDDVRTGYWTAPDTVHHRTSYY